MGVTRETRDRLVFTAADLDGDRASEYVVVPSGGARELHLYDRDPTGWLHLGQ